MSYSGHKICQTNPTKKEKNDLPDSSVTTSALDMFVSRAIQVTKSVRLIQQRKEWFATWFKDSKHTGHICVKSYSGHKICRTNPINPGENNLPHGSMTANALGTFALRATQVVKSTDQSNKWRKEHFTGSSVTASRPQKPVRLIE